MTREYIIKVDEDKKDIMGDCPLVEKPKELVRCKDCKNAGNVVEKPKHPMLGKHWCNGKTKGWHCGDWYCADAERKDGDGDGT